jgi:Flp pilus assembly protein protease CpaA
LEAFLHLLARVVLLPFLALLLIVAPFSTLANRLPSPVNRLVSHLAAYLVFLALVTSRKTTMTEEQLVRLTTTFCHNLFKLFDQFLNRIGAGDLIFFCSDRS